MADPVGSTRPDVPPSGHPPPEVGAGPQVPAPKGAWERLQHHKVLQWTLAYAAAAYTLLHATQMVAESFEWPRLIVRIVTLCLVLAVPVVVLLAWYHGHKARHRVSGAELSMMTALFIIAGSVLWAFTRNAELRPPSALGPVNVATVSKSSAPVGTTADQPAASVAVVPFANLTGDPSKDYFSDGMAEELINSLAQVPGLKVPARTSSFAYKGRNIDIRRIAQELGVATILEGSVRAAGEEIRVTAQLVDAKSGFHMWSRSYDRRFADIFKLQDDLAAAIVEALRSQMKVALAAPVASPPPTQDLEAYQLYQQANSVMTRMTQESFRRALSLYQQALDRDPNFARALSAMADLRLFFIRWGYPMPDALQSAEREASRALAIDPRLSEAQGVLGTAHATRGRWLDAERAFRAAVALNPEDAQTRSAYAIALLGPVGHLREAVEEATVAYRSAPADQIVVMRVAAGLSTLGNDTDALRYADLGVELGYNPTAEPGAGVRIRAVARAGRYAEAADLIVRGLTNAERMAGGEALTRQVYAARADPARRPQALAALRAFAALYPSEYAEDPEAYLTYADLGALDDAYAAANALVDVFASKGEISPNSWRELWSPEMRRFRRDPRFQAFVSRLRLMDYWKQYGPPDGCDLKDDRLTCH